MRSDERRTGRIVALALVLVALTAVACTVQGEREAGALPTSIPTLQGSPTPQSEGDALLQAAECQAAIATFNARLAQDAQDAAALSARV